MYINLVEVIVGVCLFITIVGIIDHISNNWFNGKPLTEEEIKAARRADEITSDH